MLKKEIAWIGKNEGANQLFFGQAMQKNQRALAYRLISI